ncbi:hypothetical protein VTO42DRAFT_7116 [Malbranchea cinnamomea]
MSVSPKKFGSISPKKLDSLLEVSSDEGDSSLTPTPTPTRARKRVTFATMNGQGHSEDSAPAQGQANGYHQDAQAHGPQGYTQAATNSKEVNGNVLANAFGGLSVQNNSLGEKYVGPKGNVTAPHGVNANGMHRPQGQYMIVPPNGAMIGPMPTPPPFGHVPPHHSQDQGTPLQYLPSNFYPGFVANTPLVPGPVPGFHWPYLYNSEVPDFANFHRDSWNLVDENNPGNFDMTGQPGYYPAAGQHDRTPMAGYLYNATPYQMMRTPGGYALQDLDALVKQEPAIPRAVPAMWTNPSELTLAKCLENREGITNVYIRGFLPETTDEMLHSYAARFGKIERCKAIVDLDTGLCKGFGFVQFYSFDACENCIRGFYYLGYQASFAQKSRNSRLKDLEDKTSTNIYCTNIPIEWTEADLRRHFEPYRVVSEKISRDEKTGVSKEVGFARFETREIAETVISEFHNKEGKDGVKLLLRFADTKAQKALKQQSNERRAYRAGEYNYSVEMVQGTPSPSLQRLQQAACHFSPTSQGSFPSPLGVGPVWTPATSISPTGPMMNKPVGLRYSSWTGRGVPNGDNTPSARGRALSHIVRGSMYNNGNVPKNGTRTPTSPSKCKTPSPQKRSFTSPRKGNARAGTTSPVPSRKEIHLSTPKSSI